MSFFGILDGTDTGGSAQNGGPLVISPLSATVLVNESFVFKASGGSRPYTFSVTLGSGRIVARTGKYTAPPAPSSDTVQVRDAVGATSEARIVAVE